MSYQNPPHTQLIAHRGNSGPSPENTRLAIEQAIALGVDMVEVDVRLSQDGVPVLVHYPTLEQTTNGDGRVHDHTLAELKQLDAGSWKGDRFAGEPVLTLTEALELARHRVPLNLDLKTLDAVQAVITAVRHMDMLDQVVITGCTRGCVKKIRAQEPNLMVLLNLSQSMEFLAQHGPALLFRQTYLAQTRNAGAVGINISHIYLNQELVTAVHQAGLSVWAWTVDDERRFQELLDLGVDSITTNWPERMRPVMRRVIETQRSGVFGVIVRRIVDPFFSEVLNGIEDVLQTEGYTLFLAASNRDSQREKAIIRTMSERRVDGVIFCSTQIGEEHLLQLNQFGVPCVLINNQALEDTAVASVFHDDADGSYQITQHLIELGHTQIGYLGNNHAGRTTEDRLHGYQQAMREAGLVISPEYIINGPNGLPEGGVEGIRRYLELETCPTAIVCYNDMMAIGAIQVLQRAGKRVPDDCSITGFDNIELSAYVTPPLTTFDQPKFEMGRQAALMILKLLAEKSSAKTTDIKILRGELCVRASTAAPKKE